MTRSWSWAHACKRPVREKSMQHPNSHVINSQLCAGMQQSDGVLSYRSILSYSELSYDQVMAVRRDAAYLVAACSSRNTHVLSMHLCTGMQTVKRVVSCRSILSHSDLSYDQVMKLGARVQVAGVEYDILPPTRTTPQSHTRSTTWPVLHCCAALRLSAAVQEHPVVLIPLLGLSHGAGNTRQTTQ